MTAADRCPFHSFKRTTTCFCQRWLVSSTQTSSWQDSWTFGRRVISWYRLITRSQNFHSGVVGSSTSCETLQDMFQYSSLITILTVRLHVYCLKLQSIYNCLEMNLFANCSYWKLMENIITNWLIKNCSGYPLVLLCCWLRAYSNMKLRVNNVLDKYCLIMTGLTLPRSIPFWTTASNLWAPDSLLGAW